MKNIYAAIRSDVHAVPATKADLREFKLVGKYIDRRNAKKPLRFEYWKSVKNKQWYWRIRAGNAEPMCQSEGYKSKGGVLKAFHALFDFGAQTELVNVTPVKWGRLNRNWP